MGASAEAEKVYPEEQKVEVGGKLYRRCAAALVFNVKGEVLVGERTDRPGSWNMPQGGVEVRCRPPRKRPRKSDRTTNVQR